MKVRQRWLNLLLAVCVFYSIFLLGNLNASVSAQTNAASIHEENLESLSEESVIEGELTWEDDAGQYHYLRGVMVEIYIKDDLGSILIDTVYSDNFGFYEYVFENDQILGNDGADVFIRVYAGDGNIIVKNSEEVEYFYEPEELKHLSMGQTVYFDMCVDMTEDYGQAFQISQAVLTARDYAWEMMGQKPENVKILYPYEDDCSYNSDSKTIMIIDKESSSAKYPHSYASWDVIMHEYGHHIQHIIGNTASPGGDHVSSENNADEYENKDIGVRLAWGESWPTVFGAMAQSYYSEFLTNIDTTADSFYTAYNEVDYDIETTPIVKGEACERSIMAVLWDLFDSVNETNDTISLGHVDFWEVTTGNQSKTFSDFIGYFYGQYSYYVDDIGSNLTYYNMATSMPIMANSSSVSHNTPPEFIWSAQGGSTLFPNNSFVLIFYNALGEEILRTATTTTTSYTLTQEEWDYVMNNCGRSYTMAVSALQTNSPSTGEYVSKRTNYNPNPKFGIVDFSASSAHFVYTLLNDGTYSIKSDFDNFEGILEIPSTYEGKAVTKIDEYAFAGCTGFDKIIIPRTIMYIGEGAFNGCINLVEVDIERTVDMGITQIHSTAFNNCSNLLYIDAMDEQSCCAYQELLPDKAHLIFFPMPIRLTYLENGTYVVSKGDSIIEGEIVIPADYNGIKVTKIAEYAFYGCKNMTGIILNEGLLWIGESAFMHTSLENVIIPKKVVYIGKDAFRENENLKTVIIPENVLIIERGAFGTGGMDKYGNLTIYTEYGSRPSYWDKYWNGTIGSYESLPTVEFLVYRPVFWGCELSEDGKYVVSLFNNTSNVNDPNEVRPPYRPGYAFAGWYRSSDFSGFVSTTATVLQSNNKIEYYAKYINLNGYELEYFLIDDGTYSVANASMINGYSLVIPSYYNGIPITKIEIAGFANCNWIGSVLFMPDCQLKVIGAGAFYGCSLLRTITIPRTVEVIGQSAFEGCEFLEYVYLQRSGEDITEINDFAFSECYMLQHIVVPEQSLTAYTNQFVTQDMKNLVCTATSRLTYTLLPNGEYMVSKGSAEIYGELIIPSIYNGAPVTRIAEGAFMNCSNITSVVIPSSIYTIGASAFKGCSGINFFIIPSSVEDIGAEAFSNCEGLYNIDLLRPASMGVTQISPNAFGATGIVGCPNLVSILVPDEISFFAYYELLSEYPEIANKILIGMPI